MDSFLLQTALYLCAAVIAVPLAARLGLGSVLGYLVAGMALGLIPAIGSHTQELQHFAEFGVVMMLFLIGLELEPRALWDMRHRLMGLGGLQVMLTLGATMAASMAIGLPWQTALAIGMILALSSTAIVLQTLSEKGLMQSPGGRSTFSVLLTQDIAVIPMLAAIPLLSLGENAITIAPDGSMVRAANEDTLSHSVSLVEGLPGWGVTIITMLAVATVILAGIYLTRPVFRYIHHARLREMYTATALLIVVGTAVLMSMVGLSPALGTFLAGMVLANSEFRHEIESDLEPFKGLLLGLFFITVGAGISFATLMRDPVTILALTFALMILKGLILYGLGTLFKLRGRDRWLFALGLAQAGEFGFVLVSFSLAQGVLPTGLAERLLLIVALSMLLTPLFFILYEQLSKRIAPAASPDAEEDITEQGTVIIAGIGRFGQVVNRLIQGAGFSTVVLDADLDAVTTMRQFGTRGFFGDPSRPNVLAAAGLETATILVVALDDRATALRLVRYARKQRPDLHIIARAYDRVHVYQLYRAGADDIVREMFDSSLRAGRYALENLGLNGYEASEAEMAFYHSDRASMRELAQLWKPGISVANNSEYVTRSRELNSDLETAILARTNKARGKTDTTPQEPNKPPNNGDPVKD